MMRRYGGSLARWFLLAVSLWIGGNGLAGEGEGAARSESSAPAMAQPDALPQSLRPVIALGAEYLIANCDPYGKFAYVRYEDAARKTRDQYNLLRHCGAIYALGMVVDAQSETLPRVAPVIRRACEYLRVTRYLAPLPDAPEMLAIWEIPGVVNKRAPAGTPIVGKLGGAGLGLLALLADYRCSGIAQKDPAEAEKKREEMRRLARFILYMQRPDGFFYSRYLMGKGYDDSFFSLYYPGEAMLGLLELYRVDPDPVWLKTVALGMRYLAVTRKEANDYPPDHWALLASARLVPLLAQAPDLGVSREQVLEHARKICQDMVSDQLLDESSPECGSFRAGGQTCPTAIRVEGMLAALTFLPAEDPLTPQVRRSCDLALRFLQKAMVATGPLAGGMPRSVCKVPEPEDNAKSETAQKGEVGVSAKKRGGDEAGEDADAANARYDNARMGEIRIDYVQHALCAMLMRAYPQVAEGSPGNSGVKGQLTGK